LLLRDAVNVAASIVSGCAVVSVVLRGAVAQTV